MNEVTLKSMLEVAEQLHVTMVKDAYGDTAIPQLRTLLESIRSLYRRVAPEIYTGMIVLVKSLDDAPLDLATPPLTVSSLDLLPPLTAETIVLQSQDNGTFLLWQIPEADPVKLSTAAIVYSFKRGNENFYADGKQRGVIKLVEGFASNFAIPTFHSVRTALETYRATMARFSTCKLLTRAWFDGNRIFFVSSPEWILRDSLVQFLHASLGTEAEVRPEQNMDETHPVDIKIEWFMSKKIALIEVKWLGKSRNADKITVEYSESRANSGARQLAEYLEMNYTKAPIHHCRGYLVVFDARRANVKADTASISRTDGLHYQSAEITYDPECHKVRPDLEEPVRFFLEPICSC